MRNPAADMRVQETPPRAWRRPMEMGMAAAQGGNTSTCVEKTGSESRASCQF